MKKKTMDIVDILTSMFHWYLITSLPRFCTTFTSSRSSLLCFHWDSCLLAQLINHLAYKIKTHNWGLMDANNFTKTTVDLQICRHSHNGPDSGSFSGANFYSASRTCITNSLSAKDQKPILDSRPRLPPTANNSFLNIKLRSVPHLQELIKTYTVSLDFRLSC